MADISNEKYTWTFGVFEKVWFGGSTVLEMGKSFVSPDRFAQCQLKPLQRKTISYWYLESVWQMLPLGTCYFFITKSHQLCTFSGYLNTSTKQVNHVHLPKMQIWFSIIQTSHKGLHNQMKQRFEGHQNVAFSFKSSCRFSIKSKPFFLVVLGMRGREDMWKDMKYVCTIKRDQKQSKFKLDKITEKKVE